MLEGRVTTSLVVGGLVVVGFDGCSTVEVGEADVCLNGSVTAGKTISFTGVSAMGEPPVIM